MSHFACAEQPDHPLNDRQMRVFREMRQQFRGIPSSLANSSGIFLSQTAYCDLVRPGYALYGGNPIPGHSNPMRPVVELKGRIIQIRNVKRGDTVGYGATWTAKRPTKLAVVAVGYADGYARAASGTDAEVGAQVLVGGRLCNIVGRVSMDLLTVDVTDLADGAAKRGDLVTLIGGKMDIDAFAALIDTIGYEVLTGLGRRCHRVYKSDKSG
jgi:alanine racemase